MKKAIIGLVGLGLLLSGTLLSCKKRVAPPPPPPIEEKKPTPPVVKETAKVETPVPPKAEVVFQSIYFDFDKSFIRSDAREPLESNARMLKDNPGVKIRIEGNCDERGTVEYNLALGQRRADAAREYLIDLGIKPEQMTTISYGKERPRNPGHDEEAWQENRRDDFVITEK